MHGANMKNGKNPVYTINFLAVGAVWRPVLTVWTLRLLHALFKTQKMPWRIFRGRINTYFEADTI